ncbi:polyadenylate-binding protein-interacting protein 4-like isoform X2 [Tasmannia lanceolata]|uniref:polyadenylate-binding protein-interacting protein 4-like isoform X2 n=1 Tax=Tasmannia lanceolata TaxID=3420 RepID=UPI004062D984
MSQQQVVQSRASVNGFGRRRFDREMGTRLDSKLHSGKSSSGSFSNAGLVNSSKVGGLDSSSLDRLIFLTTCLIGHHVEVQVKNGSIFSGIFHATNTDKDFGIILKMARLTKDGAFRGQKPAYESVGKAPSKTLIIPPMELVQVIAKDVPISADGYTDGYACEKRQDIMIDSFISQSHHVEVERELERWTPDNDDLQCPELENIFDGTWNRNWDQFETNEALFGVKSTFDEELYTTKLERGPRMIDLEREASRIAREIEGEETQDLHLAEERGIQFHEDFDLDEESRFSSVFRRVDVGVCEENEEMMLDASNNEIFGGSSGSVINKSVSGITGEKNNDGAQSLSSCSSLDEGLSSQIAASMDLFLSASGVHHRLLLPDCASKSFPVMGEESRLNESPYRNQHGGKSLPKESAERKIISEEVQTSKSQEKQASMNMKKTSLDKGRLSPSATAYASPSSKGQEYTGSIGESSDCVGSAKAAIQPVNVHIRPGSSMLSTSECATSVSSGPGLSSSSSVGSLSSEKSTLNPYAKEFKFNPNAKSFTPSLASVRPPPSVSEGSFYFPTNVSAVPHMHSVPVGIGACLWVM